MHEVLCLAKCD